MDSNQTQPLPMILAPAGNRDAFLAALAAGADAVYCGLKSYSARMEAKNFTLGELAVLTRLAHGKGRSVYVALNSLVKTDELNALAGILRHLSEDVRPDALIVQDLSVIPLCREQGFEGRIHLSTLAHVGFSRAMKVIAGLPGVDRAVIPRELNIDEIRAMAEACPAGIKLEVFVHGALCYGISGRCYWSSFLGGKSGLRGRCVQPCRRTYEQNGRKQRFFSCRDLSLDVLTKVLQKIPNIAAWKIEGRKKSAHYVYYTTTAYRLLRDHPNDAQTKKNALGLLEMALGRPGGHYFFLPQRPYNPIDEGSQAGSGLYLGKVGGGRQRPFFVSREELLPGDVIRVGCEDETWHKVYRINSYVPKKGRFDLKTDGKSVAITGTPVFLTDRREQELQRLLSDLEGELKRIESVFTESEPASIRLPKKCAGFQPEWEMTVFRSPAEVKTRHQQGLWLSRETANILSPKKQAHTWWWLPPAIWPDREDEFSALIQKALASGSRWFVLNSPWQRAFFDPLPSLKLWAGPFCNIANPMAVDVLRSMGFCGAIVSPELSAEDYFQLPKNSPLPLGVLISGNWPLCISRVPPPDLDINRPFTSPKKETAWAAVHDENVWIYPNWQADLRSYRRQLAQAGYSLFVNLTEPIPEAVEFKQRPGKWNWDLSFL